MVAILLFFQLFKGVLMPLLLQIHGDYVPERGRLDTGDFAPAVDVELARAVQSYFVVVFGQCCVIALCLLRLLILQCVDTPLECTFF